MLPISTSMNDISSMDATWNEDGENVDFGNL